MADKPIIFYALGSTGFTLKIGTGECFPYEAFTLELPCISQSLSAGSIAIPLLSSSIFPVILPSSLRTQNAKLPPPRPKNGKAAQSPHVQMRLVLLFHLS